MLGISKNLLLRRKKMGSDNVRRERGKRRDARPLVNQFILYAMPNKLILKYPNKKNGVGLAEGEERGETPDPRESASIL
jgi:hypothetical protein